VTKFNVAGSVRSGKTKRPPYSGGAVERGISGGEEAVHEERTARANSASGNLARPLGGILKLSPR